MTKVATKGKAAIDIHTISLPSLIHRIGGEQAKVAKQIAQETQCKIKRIRRSRNWQVEGMLHHLDAFSVQLKQVDERQFQFLIKKIDDNLVVIKQQIEPLELQVKRLLDNDPTMTLAELIQQTQCTLAQARTARANLEEALL